MKIRIEDITEAEVIAISEALQEEGRFAYDEDFTTLYGALWAIVGLEFTNPAAASTALELLGWSRTPMEAK